MSAREIGHRDSIVKRMLSDNAGVQPSLFQRIWLCQCYPETRVANAIEEIPEIAGLAGITMQDGQLNQGSLQTFRWARFDKKERMLNVQVLERSTPFST